MSQVNPSPSPDAFDRLLQQWPHDHHTLDVRLVALGDREVLQMRVDLGVLQMELYERPDGQRPYGAPTLYEHLLDRSHLEAAEFTMDETLCGEVDREFMQFYHRRISWLRLERYAQAERDSNHTLALMDFCREHATDDLWMATHEHYRPLVMFHRAQAAALAELQRNGAEPAVVVLDCHVAMLQRVFDEQGHGAAIDQQEMLHQLQGLRESLTSKFTLRDQLEAELKTAIEEEEFEAAARLRDVLRELDADD